MHKDQSVLVKTLCYWLWVCHMCLGLPRWRTERWIRATRGATWVLQLDCCQVRPAFLRCGVNHQSGWSTTSPNGVFSAHHGRFFLLVLRVFISSLLKNRKGWQRQAHAVFDNPPSTAGTHRHYPTKIIQCKHTACLSAFPFFPETKLIGLFKPLSLLLSVLYYSLHFLIFLF